MASVEDVKSAISHAIVAIDHAIRTTDAVHAKINGARQAARAVTHGTEHPKVIEGIARLHDAEREALRVIRVLNASIAAATAYQRHI